MEHEFDNVILGTEITFNGRWSPVAGTLDMRQEAIPDNQNNSTIRMRRENGMWEIFTFRNGAVVVAEDDRINFNIEDIVN